PAYWPDATGTWPTGWTSGLPMPETGMYPLPMTACILPSRATGPLPMDFIRRLLNETTFAFVFFFSSAADRVRRRRCFRRKGLPADQPGGSQGNDGQPGSSDPGRAGTG